MINPVWLMDPAKTKNLYERLEISKDASSKEIIFAYRQKVLAYHPDHNEDPDAHEQFLAISEAFDVLRNEVTRKMYDAFGVRLSSIDLDNPSVNTSGEKRSYVREYDVYNEMYQVYEKFSTRIEDIVALCVDEKQPEFGHIGKVVYHDWTEFGIIGVMFADGNIFDFEDGVCAGDNLSSVARYYRHSDDPGRAFDRIKNEGPISFLRKYLELNVGDLRQLSKEYEILFGQSFMEAQKNISR